MRAILFISLLSILNADPINTFLTERIDATSHKLISVNEVNLTKELITIKDRDLSVLFTSVCDFDFNSNKIVCGYITLDTSSKKDFEDFED